MRTAIKFSLCGDDERCILLKKGPFVRRLLSFGTVLIVAIFSASGCGAPTVSKADTTYDKLSWIGDAYMKATDDLRRAPANFDELSPYLKKHGEPAEVRRSDNDNEEFVILWNVNYHTYENERKIFPVIAYEKNGRSGQRYVLQMRMVSQLTDEQLKQATFPPGQKAPI